jgi:hypothetical protein
MTEQTMRTATIALTFTAVVAMIGCHRAPPSHRTFATPDEAVRALIDAAKGSKMDDLRAIFGPDAGDLIASSDPATARQNREVFAAAAAERWQLVDEGDTSKVLVVGNERWPFPVPLAKVADGWHFDTAAGKEEILDRRIGRNELAAIRLCHTYVAAQRLYASRGHDGRPAGVYAASFRSTAGKEDGLFWPAAHGQKRSPLGDLVAQAAVEGTPLGTTGQPAPFHGYYFRILTAQGSDANGGAKNYVANGHLSGGFALVAWPAQYDVTGITTFVVNQDGVVREKDLGADTDAAVKGMANYNPDASWQTVQ